MTIKGKKKQQSRGSQARRRPASAPRPVVPSGSKRVAWHHTPAARVVGGLLLVLALSAGAALFTNFRENAREADKREDALAAYTNKVRSLLQDMTAPASEMAAAPAAPDAEGFEDLKKNAKGWEETFRTVQGKAVGIVPASGTENANGLFQQSLRMYTAAAATYRLAPQAEGDLVSGILARAAEQRDQAASLWQSATDVLDEARSDEGMNASGLRPPAQAPSQGLPQGLEGVEGLDLEGLQEGGAELEGGDDHDDGHDDGHTDESDKKAGKKN